MNLPYQDPALPDAPTQEDLNQFSSPVAELPQQAVPEKPSKGMSFDFSVIDVQTQDEYNALPPVLKQLRHEIVAYGKRPSPQEAAAMLDRIKTEFDAINSPKAQAQAQAAKLSADKTQLDMQKTKLDIQKANTESRAAATQKLEEAQKTYNTASDMVWLMDNMRGGKRGEVAENNEKWRSRVGAIDGRWPSLLSSGETIGWNADYNALKAMIGVDKSQDNKGQGAVSDSERALFAQAASLGLEQARDEEGFKAAFERMYDLALTTQEKQKNKLLGQNENASPQGMPQPAQQPAAPPPLPQFQSREQVIQAVNSGQISREQGAQALRAQFGNQFR